MASDDPGRFEQLMATHGPALRRLAQAYGRDRADAEDLFQEIAFAVWRALPSFRGESSERTFLFRIGHNRGLTHRARRRPAGEDLDAGIPDGAPGPDTLLTASIRRDRLVDAVRRLPDIQREVVMLCLEGCSTQEIADVLGITANNAAVRLTRARKALRDLLLAEGGNDDSAR